MDWGIYQQRFESGTQIVDGDRIIGGVADDLLVGARAIRPWLVVRAMMR